MLNKLDMLKYNLLYQSQIYLMKILEHLTTVTNLEKKVEEEH